MDREQDKATRLCRDWGPTVRNKQSEQIFRSLSLLHPQTVNLNTVSSSAHFLSFSLPQSIGTNARDAVRPPGTKSRSLRHHYCGFFCRFFLAQAPCSWYRRRRCRSTTWDEFTNSTLDQGLSPLSYAQHRMPFDYLGRIPYKRWRRTPIFLSHSLSVGCRLTTLHKFPIQNAGGFFSLWSLLLKTQAYFQLMILLFTGTQAVRG